MDILPKWMTEDKKKRSKLDVIGEITHYAGEGSPSDFDGKSKEELLKILEHVKPKAEEKNKGGYVKKYAHGGSVRKTKLSDY